MRQTKQQRNQASRRYLSTPNGQRKRAEQRKLQVIKARELIRNLKSKPCMDCGNTFDPVCMDFDHRDPLLKRGRVASITKRGFLAVLEEVAKCDVVCSNCHRIRTHRLRNHLEWIATVRGSPRAKTRGDRGSDSQLSLTDLMTRAAGGEL